MHTHSFILINIIYSTTVMTDWVNQSAITYHLNSTNNSMDTTSSLESYNTTIADITTTVEFMRNTTLVNSTMADNNSSVELLRNSTLVIMPCPVKTEGMLFVDILECLC